MSRIVTTKGATVKPKSPWRCLGVIGVCDGKTLTVARCKELCIDYFTDLNEFGYCEQMPGDSHAFCYCEYNCYKHRIN